MVFGMPLCLGYHRGIIFMLIISDVHGKFESYLRMVKNTDDETFQLGDMGLGFGTPLPELDPRHQFIRGNHDSPLACEAHPNYAGDYGYSGDMFFLGGAFSIDGEMHQRMMKSGSRRIWWPDEELDQDSLDAAISLYKQFEPNLVITHDCPTSITELMLGPMLISPEVRRKQFGDARPNFGSRTGDALQKMFEYNPPSLWVFGHYHMKWDQVVNGTRFVCLPELGVLSI